MTQVWRFGYGSNVGLDNLQTKKNLKPTQYLVGTIQGWELYFKLGIPYVEPGWAAVRPESDAELHGSAFLISEEEALALDRQERGYHVVPSRFVAYDGEVVEGVGLYVPKKPWSSSGGEVGVPSLRYLRLLRKGAREAGLSTEWIHRLDSVQHYVTPPEVRAQTERWISDFHSDPARKDAIWTAEYLSKFCGADPNYPAHTSVMEYVVKIQPDCMIFPSWKGHTVTRRNLLQFRGMNLDENDILFGQSGFRPLPKLRNCSDEEKEFLMQNLECLLHRGGTIVARLKDFLEDQDESHVT